METTEKIVEAYVRYVRGWFTRPHVRCPGGCEIDLLAIDASTPGRRGRYHIESGVCLAPGFAPLSNQPFSVEALRQRISAAAQRRTLGYFVTRKFGDPRVVTRLTALGFRPGRYAKVIVSWGWHPDVPAAARAAGVELWDFRHLLREMAERSRREPTHWTDDMMRALQLLSTALKADVGQTR